MPHSVPPCRTLVVPIAPTTQADRAVRIALRLACPEGSDVYLLHVSSLTDRDVPERRAYLSDLRMAFRHGLGARSSVRLHVAAAQSDHPAQGISLFARSVDADVIVLPTRGSGRPLNGEHDVAAELLEEAPCPVLTAPSVPARAGHPLHRLLMPSCSSGDQIDAARLACAWTGLRPQTLAPMLGRPFFFEPSDLYVAPAGRDALPLVRSQPCALWIPPVAREQKQAAA